MPSSPPVTVSNEGAMALMRDLMDKALAAPNGLRFVVLDAKHGGRAGALKEARGHSSRFHLARSRTKAIQFRASGLAASAALSDVEAMDPDTLRTAYDTLYSSITRNEADDGWVFVLSRADLSSLDGLEIF